MAERVEIEVEITASGEVHLTVKGAKGKSCVDLARPLEEALGEVAERKLTAEYYKSEGVAARREVKGPRK